MIAKGWQGAITYQPPNFFKVCNNIRLSNFHLNLPNCITRETTF